MAKRQPKGRPTIYRGSDGLFHSWPAVGFKPDGTEKRKHVKRKTSDEVKDELDAIQERKKQSAGHLAKIETLGQWLHHWVHVINLAKRDAGQMKHTTWVDYESICRVHLIPDLGHWRISGTKRRLEPEHIEAMYAQLGGQGLAASYVGRMHTALNQALRIAYKRGRADRNVIELVDRPTFHAKKIKGVPYQDACKLVGHALKDELAARWLLAIITGPRQGEVLGIRWSQVHLDPPGREVPHIKLEKQIQRHKWQHGCPDPVACVKTRKDAADNPVNPCRTKPCEPAFGHGCNGGCGKKLARYCPDRKRIGSCYRHVAKDGSPKPCPPLCPSDCTGHASTCPERKDGGLVETDLKTHASEAPMPLGSACTQLLREHRERQIQAGKFDEKGYVFPGHKRGTPMDPRQDYSRWQQLLTDAGVGHHRLHAARHTTGSVLSATGADLPMIRDVLRQADTAIAAEYVDFGLEARRDAVDRVAAALIDGDLSMIIGAKRVA